MIEDVLKRYVRDSQSMHDEQVVEMRARNQELTKAIANPWLARITQVKVAKEALEEEMEWHPQEAS